MGDLVLDDLSAVVRSAAESARLAPSVHNTQPWRFRCGRDVLEIEADPDRRLTVLDPRGRQLLVSCGCALLNARAAVAASGFQAVVRRFPEPRHPGLLARVHVGAVRSWSPLVPLHEQVARRRTNRREFLDPLVPAEVLADLRHAAACEDVELVIVEGTAARSAVAELTAQAEARELADAAYRAELAAWTTDDPRRPDGVQARSVPFHGEHDTPDPVPIRDFDERGHGWLPPSSGSVPSQCFVVLVTDRDDPAAWLRTGEALQRVWLTLTRAGFAASPLTQAVEVAETRGALRTELELRGVPQLLLRIGHAPEVPATPRRPLADLLD